MINAKKAIVFALALMMLLPLAASADKLDDIKAAGKLVVGASAGFPPYEFWYTDPATGNESLEGFEMKFAQGLAEHLGVEFVLADQAFSGLITELRAGTIDVITSGMSMKPERLEVVDFSTPYFNGKQVMLVKTADLDTYKTPDNMNGKKLGVQTGALQVDLAAQQFPKAEAMQLDNISVLVMELKMGNIDGVLLADSVAASFASVFPEVAISEIPVEYSSAGVGAAIAKGDGNEAFLAAINDYIALVKGDGTFDKWVEEAYKINGLLLKQQ